MWPLFVAGFLSMVIFGYMFNGTESTVPPHSTLYSSCEQTSSCLDATASPYVSTSYKTIVLNLTVYLAQLKYYMANNTLTASTQIYPEQSVAVSTVMPGVTYSPLSCNSASCFKAYVGSDGATVFVTAETASGITLTPSMIERVGAGSIWGGVKHGSYLYTVNGTYSFSFPSYIADGKTVIVISQKSS